LLSEMGKCTLDKNNKDEWVYLVKSAYNIIRNINIDEDVDLYGQLWKIKVLPSTLHFAWKLMINKVATRDNLIKR